MTKIINGLSMSLDGIGGGNTEADFWDVHKADSRLWAQENGRIGARLFEAIGVDTIPLERTHLSGSTGVTHLRYSVVTDREAPSLEESS